MRQNLARACPCLPGERSRRPRRRGRCLRSSPRGLRQGIRRVQRCMPTPPRCSMPKKPDIVSICTWPPLHADLTELAFAKGVKAVWCEKPMSVSISPKPTAWSMPPTPPAACSSSTTSAATCSGLQPGARPDPRRRDRRSRPDHRHLRRRCPDRRHPPDRHDALSQWRQPGDRRLRRDRHDPEGDVNPGRHGHRRVQPEPHAVRAPCRDQLDGDPASSRTAFAGIWKWAASRAAGYQRFIIDGTEGRIEVSGDQAFDDGSHVKVRRRQDGPQESAADHPIAHQR